MIQQVARKVDVSISLTSWKPRLNSLPLVLLGLLEQKVRPLSIDLWLTLEDMALIDPTWKVVFESHGVRFLICDDLGPHKKWLPRVESGSKTPFVICDDDILYPPNWLESLLGEDRGDAYVGVRCNRMSWGPNRILRPYSEWQKDVPTASAPSLDLFVTGCGGAVVYPERLLPYFIDRKNILQRCPRADDIWLKAAHLAAGFPCYKTRFSFPCLEIPDSQTSGLLRENVDQGLNDLQMGVLAEFASRIV